MQCNINKIHVQYHTSLDLLSIMECTCLLIPQIKYTCPLNCVHCFIVHVFINI